MGHKKGRKSAKKSDFPDGDMDGYSSDEEELYKGAPDWVQPQGLDDVAAQYYRRLDPEENLDTALASFARTGHKLLSGMSPGAYGKTIPPGNLGMYFNRGRPRFRLPGKYFRNGYRCEWSENHLVSTNESLIRHGDVVIVQLGQNQTSVVLKPDQTVGVLPPGRHILRDRMRVVGEGIYNRSGVNARTGRVTDHVQHVFDGGQWRATLVDVPKDMAAVVERVTPDGAILAIVPPGRYTLTEEGVKFKKLLTLFEEERTVENVQAWTNDSVEVFVSLQLRFRLANPDKIAHTKYADAFDVLQESAQSAVQSTVGTINYQQMMQTISLSSNVEEVSPEQLLKMKKRVEDDPFDEQVRKGCRQYLANVGKRVGVRIVDVFVKSRHFNEALTQQMQQQAAATLTSVTKAKNIKRDLDTERKKVEADAVNNQTKADSNYYASERESKAAALEVKSKAEADADARERSAQAIANVRETLATAEAEAKELIALAKAKAERIRREAEAYMPEGDSHHSQQLAVIDAFAKVMSSLGRNTTIIDTAGKGGGGDMSMLAAAMAMQKK